MRIAYLDCFAGISGDMMLGALLDAGVPPEVLHEAVAALNLGASLRIERVDRSGISAAKVDVFDGAEPAEKTVAEPRRSVAHSHPHQAGQPHAALETDGPEDHSHVHGRSLTEIRAMIQAARLAPEAKALAIRTFELLGSSEARIHNVPVDEIHFHEVGAVDAIVDIVAASAGICWLKIGAWHSSPLNVGGGMVKCAHGTFPVPAPATADLLRGAPTYSAHIQKELVTPTGAALLRALSPAFGPQPAMTVDRIGYGAGTRNPPGFPNVLRLSIGDTAEPAGLETVTVLEAALDDITGQLLAHVAERVLAEGALDVMLTPVIMKKGRPGSLLTVLCNPVDQDRFAQLLLRETTTLGLRIRQDRRAILDRAHVTVETPYGPIRVKVGSQAGEALNATPEFEDCRAAALAHNAPVKLVLQAATAAYANR
ncbi:hypothetical protein SAMN05421770_102474 [Granulicella rosea]|uniref:Putative nickel insertion protein n=1 Tax=Granulicella rosea TaxID=474952 RepID=A0A239HN24_9BACT|nr:nickel pincer cofactor biosynthesis protein LarC [Granulicella rosea]SNS82740.1 hypothetical protein SAMN05421770_102474 [Granulicella rosea]